MLRRILLGTVAVLVSSGLAQAAAKDDVQAAVKKLADGGNYSFTTTTVGGFGAGTSTGKTQKDGLTTFTIPAQDADYVAIIEGNKSVVQTPDGWKTVNEMVGNGDFTPETFTAWRVQNFLTPTDQATDILGNLKEITKTDDAYTATFTEEQAKDLQALRARRAATTTQPAGANAIPQFPIANAKGSVKFWLKDGQVIKMELHLTGTFTFNGQDVDSDRTITTEIKDIGSTKIDVPADAKKKLDEQPTTKP